MIESLLTFCFVWWCVYMFITGIDEYITDQREQERLSRDLDEGR